VGAADAFVSGSAVHFAVHLPVLFTFTAQHV
jgi:hypothetical protein